MKKVYEITLNDRGRFSVDPPYPIQLSQNEAGVQFAFSLPTEWKACESVTVEYINRDDNDSRRFSPPLAVEDERYIFEVQHDFTEKTGKMLIQLVGQGQGGSRIMTVLENSPDITVKPSINAPSLPVELPDDGVYTETINQLLQRVDALEALVEDKASKSEVEAKADKTELETKADRAEVETKADREELETKADRTDLETKADRTELEEKADIALVEGFSAAITNLENTVNVEGTRQEIIWEGNAVTPSTSVPPIDISLPSFDYTKYSAFEFWIGGTCIKAHKTSTYSTNIEIPYLCRVQSHVLEIKAANIIVKNGTLTLGRTGSASVFSDEAYLETTTTTLTKFVALY